MFVRAGVRAASPMASQLTGLLRALAGRAGHQPVGLLVACAIPEHPAHQQTEDGWLPRRPGGAPAGSLAGNPQGSAPGDAGFGGTGFGTSKVDGITWGMSRDGRRWRRSSGATTG